ncbi:DgyrCDS388 [Dimorphilus gyrociliatus]|uniref:ABC-type xenobiotic transporter n=1 Tax=Dimorphilus gyrociliatus TaxID=2664684 RepID=A0A7I8V8V2_9ANNE|nr:DgyrCDS388 [Dimorphilus gyrociliatus]
MSWDWEALCGNSSKFTVWKGDDFGKCFEQMAFNLPTSFFILIITAFHLGKNYGTAVRGIIPCSPTLHIRFYISMGLFICPLINTLLLKFYLKINSPLISMISSTISCVTWCLHSLFVWKLRRYYRLKISGPFIITIGIILKCAFYVIKLRSVLKETDSFTIVERYISYVQASLIAIYILTLIPCQRPSISSGIQVRILNDSETSYFDNDNDICTMVLERPLAPLGRAEENCSVISRLTFHWVQSLMARGASKKIDNSENLFDLPEKMTASYVEEYFKENSRGRNNDKRSLLSNLNRTFGKEFYPLGLLKFFADALGFLGPLLLNWLVIFMEKPNEPRWHGYIYAAGLFITAFLTALLTSHFNYLVTVVSLKMRASLISSIYAKSLKTSTVSLSKFNTGQIVNYMSTDVDRIVNFCISFHQFWSLPFQIAVSLWLLYLQVGVSFLAGLAFAILLIPINRYLANAIGRLSNDMMNHKDARVKLMSEILHGIRIIKFYAWEDIFSDKINNLRSKELKSLKGRKYLDAFCVYFWATTPVLISILTFTTYAISGHELTAARVFTSLALFNMLISPLNAFPWVLNGLMEAWVSLKRVQQYDDLEEKNWNNHYNSKHNDSTDIISVDNATFIWNKPTEEEETLLKLRDISLNIKKGSFVGLTGPVGCGKSSLFSAILGEMEMIKGHLSFSPDINGISLQTQEAWIQHGTVQQNILFGNELDDRFYHRVLDSCALLPDLEILPAGDETEIGENGVTLSGGQKARISLARAIYQNKDVIFMDDPFAAVDSHVAKHIYSSCLMGLLSGKTRFLSTHHTKFLRNADVVIVMKDGKIDKIGRPCDVLQDQTAIPSSTVCKNTHNANYGNMQNNKENGILVKEEVKEKGTVRLSVYFQYWKAVGTILASFVMLSLFLMQGILHDNFDKIDSHESLMYIPFLKHQRMSMIGGFRIGLRILKAMIRIVSLLFTKIELRKIKVLYIS